MNLEIVILGAVFAAAIWLLLWRFGVALRPWPEILINILLYTALWFALRAFGLGSAESVTIAFITAGLLVWAGKRFVHRPA